MIADTAKHPNPKRKRGASQPVATPRTTTPRMTTVAAPSVPEGPSGEVIEFIALDKIHRHPLNRHIDPADPKTQALAESICERGQLEPLRVRLIPSERDQYQLISGERRYTALRLLNRLTARCLVVDVDPATALVEVAAANSHREDLDPIQRAQLMQELMKPIHQGGSGLTLLEAGAVFGLRSESGCKNAMRLLKLPDSLKALLISGELPERLIRQLVPYTVAKPIIEAIAAELTDKRDWVRSEAITSLISCDGQPPFIEEAIREHARPVSADIKHRYPYPMGEHACLFDWREHEAQLQIVELPTEIEVTDHNPKRERGIEVQPRKWALNVKLWDKLQEPLVKAAVEAGKSKSKTPSTAAKGQPPKKLTPKQQAVADKQRAEEADRRLDTFSADWLDRLLRCSLADRCSDDSLVALTLPWIVGQCPAHDLRGALESAMAECQVPRPAKSKGQWASFDTLSMLATVAKGDTTRFDVMAAFWRIILWPVSRLVGDAAKKSSLTAAGTLPDKLIPIGYGTEHSIPLAALAGVSAETAWRDGATEDSDQRRLISVWLCRHTKDQLHALRAELNVTEGSSTMGRDELAGCVLSAHRPGKPLRLPKRLAALTN